MQVVSIKFQEPILEKIDKSIIKNNFNSRTEFIREAVRDKLTELEKETLLKKFIGYKGKGKTKTTDKEWRRVREEYSKEVLDELERRFK